MLIRVHALSVSLCAFPFFGKNEGVTTRIEQKNKSKRLGSNLLLVRLHSSLVDTYSGSVLAQRSLAYWLAS
jgi:hypothetical protein